MQWIYFSVIVLSHRKYGYFAIRQMTGNLNQGFGQSRAFYSLLYSIVFDDSRKIIKSRQKETGIVADKGHPSFQN